MKDLLFWKPLVLMLVLGCLFGCGGDDVEDNGGIADPAPDEDNQIPTITIEELRREEARASGEVHWRLNASPAPKTDLAVMKWKKSRLYLNHQP